MNEKQRDELKKFKNKAEQNRQMHFSMSKKANMSKNLLHIFALTGSSIIAILTFADSKTFAVWFPSITDDNYKLIVGGFAGVIFIITILEEYLGFAEKASSHENVGKQLTGFIRRVSTYLSHEKINEDDVEQFSAEYIEIHENAPIIPDKVFLKEKQRLKRKIDVSKKLDHNPHMSVNFYLLKMKIKNIFNLRRDDHN